MPRFLALLALLICAFGAFAQPLWQPRVLNPNWGGLEVLPGNAGLLAWGSDATLWLQRPGDRDWRTAQTMHSARVRAFAAAFDGSHLVSVGDRGLLMHSADGGLHWINAESPATKALLAVDINGATTLAVGSDGLALRSRDAGRSWERLQGPTGTLTRVRAAGAQDWWIGGATGYLWHSGDDGDHWTRHAARARGAVDALQRDGEGGMLAAMADGSLLQASGSQGPWRRVHHSRSGSYTRIERLPAGGLVATGTAGACAWREAGVRWHDCSARMPRLVRALASDPQGRSWVMVGEAGMLLHSVDRGRHWRAVGPARGYEARTLEAVVWDPARDTFVAAGEGGLLLRSDSRGVAWQVEAIAPSHYVHDVAAVPAGGLVAAMSYRTLARSDDGGRYWRTHRFDALQEPAFLFSVTADVRSGGLVVGGGQGSVMVAPDGRHWHHTSTGHGTDYLGALTDPQRHVVILYGTGGAVLRVDSVSGRWRTVNLPTRDALYGGFATADGRLFLVGANGAVLQSSDGGATWQIAARLGERSLYTGAVTPAGTAVVVAGDGGALYRAARDLGGAVGDWQQIAVPKSAWRVLQADSQGRALWLAGSEGRLLRSTDDAREWQNVPLPTASSLRALVHDATRARWWIPGRDGTLLRSDDDGLSWETVFTHTEEHFKGAWVEPASGALLLYGARLVRLEPAPDAKAQP